MFHFTSLNFIIKFLHQIYFTTSKFEIIASVKNLVSLHCLCLPQAHAEASGGARKVTSVFRVPPDIQALMTHPADSASFAFTDPVGALLRLLLLSPMGADARNLAFSPEDAPLRDYCNGARMQRVHDALPQGAAALTCAIFFDEINRDEKGFNAGF